jgi:hypothetical protein
MIEFDLSLNSKRLGGMKNISELASYIRFQLSQLSSQNKHHEFEDLARHFARLRICENIIPATGPVGVGGDQGRDFESFRSYLNSTPIATSTFLGHSKDKKIVFACSLKKDIIQKIKSDVSIICEPEEKLDSIYYFCEANVPVSKRHQLQKWSKSKFNIELEIIDGQALAEMLTNLDVFWIAEEFLDVPSDLYPKPDKTEEKYEKYKHQWLIQKAIPNSFADFFQIKYGLRFATFNLEAKPDLLKWIHKMEKFFDERFHYSLHRRAIYEVCVAALRGLNRLSERRKLVEEYFSRLENLDSISDIQDATTLLHYCSTAHINGHFQIETEKLHHWTKTLISVIIENLKRSKSVAARCRLLQIRGQASLLQFSRNTSPTINIDDLFKWWERLLKEVKAAPLFPIEDFADHLNVLTDLIGEDHRFLSLTGKVDELLSERSSGFLAAEKCRDRAISYFNSGKYVLAIKSLHQAKIKWFSSETLRGSLLSMLFLSECYQRLGLIYAAKYYAACIAYLAYNHDDESLKSFVPRSLFVLADCCYQAGEWLSFVNISSLALAAHNTYDEAPLNIEKHEKLKILLTHTSICRAITKRFDKDLFEIFDKKYAEWPIDSDLHQELDHLINDKKAFWNSASKEDIWERAQEGLSGHPFCDLGEKRSIRWKALGVVWTIEFKNTHLLSSISEELASTLQVILADLAHEDLVLLPTQVVITTSITDNSQMIVKELPSNEVATWKIGFPKHWIRNIETLDELRTSISSLAITVLCKCSVLEKDDLLEIIEKAFSEGLPTKTFAIRPYAELYEYFFPEKDFDQIARSDLNPLFSDQRFEVLEHEQLAWIDKDGPGYSKKKSQEYIKNRYRQVIKPVRYTLPRLLKNEGFRSQIKKLRNDGYLDWEILLIIANICIDYRAKKKLPDNSTDDEFKKVMIELMTSEEKEDDLEVPVNIFNEKRIEIQKNISLAAIAQTWGLSIHRMTPDISALKKLLTVRYHLSEDDIEHEDVLEDI